MSEAAGVGITANGKHFQPRRLGHVNLVVSNVDRSMEFYRTVIGLEEAYRQPKIKGGFLSNGNTHHDIGMVESSGPLGFGRPPGLNHVAFELETEVDLVKGYESAVKAGIEFDRTSDHDIAHAIYGNDPDGNQYEIYADVIEDWRNARSGVVTKPKLKWTPGSTTPNPNKNYHASPDLTRVEEAVFHPRRTTHAALVVEHFEKMVDHYTNVVGAVPLIGDRSGPFIILGGTLGEYNLSLFRSCNGRAPGLHHFGLEAWDDADLDAAVAGLRGKGSPPEVAVDTDLRRSVFIRDPDGIRVQFFVDRKKPAAAWSALDPDVALFIA